MPYGTLEVLLIGAKGLDNTDFLNNMDPYVVLNCRTQEHKSSVASAGAGTEPEWNETFLFTVTDGVSELHLKIMDKDTFSDDDFVGKAVIPLEPVFMEGNIPPAAYNVVKDEEFRGEIRVGLVFTPEQRYERDFQAEESYGGWKESSLE